MLLTEPISFKLWSLHKHIDDVRKDLNYSNTDVNIFADFLVLITMIFMLLMDIFYLEMIVHELVV